MKNNGGWGRGERDTEREGETERESKMKENVTVQEIQAMKDPF